MRQQLPYWWNYETQRTELYHPPRPNVRLRETLALYRYTFAWDEFYFGFALGSMTGFITVMVLVYSLLNY